MPVIISTYWLMSNYIKRKLIPIVSYDKKKLYARYLKDEKTGNVILGGYDGWLPYNEKTDCYGFDETYNDKKYLLTNSSKVYLEKRNSISNIRYIPIFTFFDSIYISNKTNVIKEDLIDINTYGCIAMQPKEFMEDIIDVKKDLNFDLQIPMEKIYDSNSNIIKYYYNDDYKQQNIFLNYEEYHTPKMFVYNASFYENYILLYNNFWICPYVFNEYEYIVSKKSPNTYGYALDLISIFNINILENTKDYSRFKLKHSEIENIFKKSVLYSATILDDYENDYFKEAQTKEDIYQKVQNDLNHIS